MRAFIPYLDETHQTPKYVAEKDSGKPAPKAGTSTLWQFGPDWSQQPDSPELPACIDPATIREWLKSCDSNHGIHCSIQLKSMDSLYRGPTLLIDIQQNCIVPGTSNRSYYALSYCWGSSVSSSFTQGNLEHFQKRDAMMHTSIILPATVKDAMQLVAQ